MAKNLKTTPSTPERSKANHTVVPRTPKKKKKKCKKKRKQSYRAMMAAITRPSRSIEDKIAEKKEALNTASAEPPKLVTI